jgi:hypothetical protein
VFLKIFHIGITVEEPQQFVDDALQLQFLGGKQGKAVSHIETHLVSENAFSSRPSAVCLYHTFCSYSLE